MQLKRYLLENYLVVKIWVRNKNNYNGEEIADIHVKSIENFLNQEELIDAMGKSNFEKCTYRNLSGGIVSIHSGWKV